MIDEKNREALISYLASIIMKFIAFVTQISREKGCIGSFQPFLEAPEQLITLTRLKIFLSAARVDRDNRELNYLSFESYE